MSNIDYDTSRILIAIGRRDADSHFGFIKFVTALLKVIHDSDKSLDKRILALHELGLADNKIDKNSEVDYYFKLLSDERDSQSVYLEHDQYQNLKESIRRSNYYIEKIARLISPSALDVKEKEEDEDESGGFAGMAR